jgi:hypothetical protein
LLILGSGLHGGCVVTQLDYPASFNRLAKFRLAHVPTRSFAENAVRNTVTEL